MPNIVLSSSYFAQKLSNTIRYLMLIIISDIFEKETRGILRAVSSESSYYMVVLVQVPLKKWRVNFVKYRVSQ